MKSVSLVFFAMLILCLSCAQSGHSKEESSLTAPSTAETERDFKPAVVCTSKFFYEPEPGADELKKIIALGVPYFVKNRNGTEFVATLNEGEFTIGRQAENGGYPIFFETSVEDPYLLHQVCPLNDDYVLYVSSVDAGPGETGSIIHAETGKQTEVTIYNPMFSETAPMSLHGFNVAEIRSGEFVIAAGGNGGILFLDLKSDRPVFKRIPMDDGEIDTGLQMQIAKGRLYFRKIDPSTYEPGQPFPAPGQGRTRQK